jgi:hypothetical protein
MAEETQTETPEAPQITLVDLQNALRVIDVASERGAFKGNELTSVGSVRDKVAAFLESVLPKEEPVEDAEAAEAE